MNTVTDLVKFAEQRRPLQNRGANSLEGSVRWALHRKGRTSAWARTLVNAAERIMRRTYRVEAGRTTSAEFRDDVRRFREMAREALDKTGEVTDANFEGRVKVISRWLANAAINAGTDSAGSEGERDPDQPSMTKTWVTMRDEKVRPTHADVDGTTVGVNERFDVGGVSMSAPGDPTAPPDLILGCRCVIAIRAATLAAAASEGDTMTVTEAEVLSEADQDDEAFLTDEDAAIPWHGVLAPEDVISGDNRKFGPESLRWRDLPLPLSWQKVSAPGHDGSVVVGRIDEIWRDGNLVRAAGVFLANHAEADEAIGLIADGGIRGVSVDVDDATMELQDENGHALDLAAEHDHDTRVITVFPEGRICGATLLPIPAFSEAFVSIGDSDALVAACECEMSVDEGTWDGSASNYTDEQYYRATIIHLVTSGPDKMKKANNKLPILTPSGSLSRAGVHAATSRLNQTDAPPDKISSAKAALRSAYKELKEDPPEALTAQGETDELEADLQDQALDALDFRAKTEDGPGWLTHPVDTERLRRYWTRGRGAAKIRWGTPGDFNRCRRNLAKYVKPQYLNGYCANRHYDATGFWPGRAPSEGGKGHGAESIALVASALPTTYSAEAFADPHLTGPTPVTVSESGQVYGHLALWGTCHIGIKGVCTTPPRSPSNYAYFHTGAVLADDGAQVPVGHITLGTGHAGPRMSAVAAASHYDNTGTVGADVSAGEDEFGIWVAGMVRSRLSDDDRHALRAAALSGDWRTVAGSLELVAALAVNVPGFPVPRTALAASGGEQTSLVAAGVLDPSTSVRTNMLDIGAAIMAAVDEIEARTARRKMSALRTAAGRDPKSRMSALRDAVRVT